MMSPLSLRSLSLFAVRADEAGRGGCVEPRLLDRLPGLYAGPFAAVAVFMTVAHASGATLTIGEGQAYRAPSQVARVVRPGDTVRISPGNYYDCTVWTVNNITIEGTGAGVVLTDTTCQGKAIFVIHADDVTVKNITFQRARVPDANGAGIRAEGANLTIDNDKFLNNQNGILAGDNAQSTMIIRNSEFIRNGACIRSCAHGVYVGHIRLLRIESSRFFDTQVGHHIKSRAARTELIGNHIEDGPNGTASYEVDIPNGGALLMTGNTIEKGPKNQNHTAAIILGEEGVSQATPEIRLENNTFTNDGPPTAFVNNITATPAQLAGNVLKGNPTKPLIGDGTVR